MLHRTGALKVLLRSGADVNALDDDGSSALHRTAMKRIEEREADLAHDIAAAEILLKHGANPNITDKLGRTPLDHAIESEFSTVAKLLRAHGGRESDPSMLAENEREKIDAERGKKEQSFFRRPVDTLSVPRPCSFNLGSDGMAVTDNGWHWGVRRGTVGVVKVRCDRPGYLHYAVLKVGSPVPTRINLSVATGRGTFEIPFDEPWRHAQIAWYHTDKPVDDLRAAIKTGKARGVDSRDLDVIPLVGEQTQQDREGASQ
jgi:ankyrin repeat protein